MAQVKFYLDKRNDNNGQLITTNVAIYLFYSFNGQRLKYFTGERIDVKNYIDDYLKKVRDPIKKAAPGAETILQNLNSIKRHLETIAANAKMLGVKTSPEYFRSKLNELVKPKPDKKEKTIDQALTIFLEITKKNKAHNTFRNTQTAVNHFKDFTASKKIKFSDIDKSLIDQYSTYLAGSGRLNNTVAKNLRVLRTFLNWCKEEKLYTNDNLKIDVKENDIDVIFLTHDEIIHLYNKELSSKHLERVRDVFIFACFTGMRYGDLAKLKKTDIKLNAAKGNEIKFYITKGKNTLSQTVPLVTISKAIIDKYSDYPGEKALPVISNQKMNDALKLIAKEAEFNEIVTIAEKLGNGSIIEKQYFKWELITCHISRKSFITVAMILGMPVEVVKSITGHSKNSKAFARYYDIIDSHKQTEMNKIFK